MRIVVIHAGSYPGRSGAEEMAFAAVAHARQRGHEVAFVGDARSWLGNDRLPCGVQPFDLRDSWIDELRAWRPDVMHLVDLVSAEVASQTLRASSSCGAPLVVTPASDVFTWERIDAGQRVLKAAHSVIAVTGAEAETLRELAPGIRVLVSGQAAASPLYAVRTERRTSEPVVLFAGRRLRSKGLWCLIAAMLRVRETLGDARLVVIGPKGDDTCLDDVDEVPPWITDLGLVSEEAKQEALSACDVLCLPSDRDVFPIVFLEAWQHGKPVVTTRFRGAEEVVRDDVDGLIVERDPASLAAALVELLGDRERMRRLGTAGRRRLDEELNWSRVGERIEEAYRQAIGAATLTRAHVAAMPIRKLSGRAIVLAGGLGRRLRATGGIEVKPLALVGELPLIEILLAQLAAQHFERATLCITSATESIREVIGDGSRFGLAVDYSRTETLLGTAGPLRLIDDWNEAALVMNADLLTSFDYATLRQWHIAGTQIATVGLIRPAIQIPYAVVDIDTDGRIVSLDEKPTLRLLCASGVYVLNPEFANVLDEQPLDMPDALLHLLGRGQRVVGRELSGRWHDVGTLDALQAANLDFAQHGAEFLPASRIAWMAR